MKDQSNTCNNTQWLAVPSGLFLTVYAACRFLSVSLGSVTMTKLWSWVSLLPETSSVEFSKCVSSWRIMSWDIIEDLQESSYSCWEGCTVVFHCFLHLSNLLHHLVLLLAGIIFVILCDVYRGHQMSIFLITVVSLLYIRKNLSSHFIF